MAARPAGEKSRVLIVDDSMFSRAVFRKLIEDHVAFQVSGGVADAEQALSFLQANTVDVVLLDIEMPGRSGLEALPDILKAAGSAPVMVISSHAEQGGAAAVRALSLGACDTLEKPGRDNLGGRFGTELIAKLVQITNIHCPKGRHSNASPVRPVSHDTRLECIAIGASTGGIPAINAILANLHSSITAPILITQHLPDSFLPSFALQLGELSPRRVMLASDGSHFLPNHVYVAPGNAHLTCRKQGARIVAHLLDERLQGQYCPAVDPMFASASECYGTGAVLILLSGMGRDGLAGAQMHAVRGGSILVQDEESCVVWGMPGSAAMAGIAEAILPPRAIADYVAKNWKGAMA